MMPDTVAGSTGNFTLRQLACPSAAKTAYLTTILGGGTLVILVSVQAIVTAPLALPWIVLLVLTVLSGVAALRLPNVPVSFSISDSFTITAALLFGPAAGTVAVAIDSLVISLQLARRDFQLQRLAFNVAAPPLAMWLAAHCFFVLAGVRPLIEPASLGRLFGPLIVFATLYFILNTGLVAAAIAFEQRRSPISVWRRHFVPLWLTYFSGTAVAALLVSLVQSRGADLVVLALVAPIPLILYVTFKNAVGRIEDQLGHLEHVNRMHLATIETLAHAIDAKDQITHGHIRRVQLRAMRLAVALGVEDERERGAIEAAALLHDMGKLAVPEHILNKPGKLTTAEFEKMKQHTDIGAEILSSIDFPYPVVPIVRHHHEHWDGRGYPAGLKGEDIPIGARILAVVDCYDALTSDRPYRKKMTATDALRILRERSGTMYDPRIVAKFLEIHSEDSPSAEASAPSAALAAILETAQSDAARRQNDAPALDPALLAAMYDLGLAMALDGTGLGDRLHGALAQVMPATCSAIYIYDATVDGLIARDVAGPYAAELRGLQIPLGQRITGWVAAQRSTIVNSDAALDLGSLTMRLDPPPRSCLSTALCAHDELVGAITIYSTWGEGFTDRHGSLLEVLAPRIALAARLSPSEPVATASRTRPRLVTTA